MNRPGCAVNADAEMLRHTRVKDGDGLEERSDRSSRAEGWPRGCVLAGGHLYAGR